MRRLAGRSPAFVLLAAALLCASSAAAAPKDLVGKPAPEFIGSQVSGEPLSLATFLGKVPVILTFWSIYCKSCTEEMAALQRLFAKYGPRQIAVIAVNEDADVGLPRVRNFLDRFPASGGAGKFTFPIFFDAKGEVFNGYGVVHLPSLFYIDKSGTVVEAIEGYDRGSEHAVISAIEKLIGTVSPEPLKEVASEAVYDLDVVVPVCGVYRDGKWYRPLDLDEEGRPEAIARARARGEEYLRREAVRLALARVGVTLASQDRPPGCGVPYGLEIRTARPEADALGAFIARLNLPRVLEVVSQETVDRDRELFLLRRIRVSLAALRDQLDADGFTIARSALRVRFIQASRYDERSFIDAVNSQFPYLSSLQPVASTRGGDEYELLCHASLEKAIEKLRGLDIGARKMSIDLVAGNIAEVALWR